MNLRLNHAVLTWRKYFTIYRYVFIKLLCCQLVLPCFLLIKDIILLAWLWNDMLNKNFRNPVIEYQVRVSSYQVLYENLRPFIFDFFF